MITSFSVNTQTPPQSKRSSGHGGKHVADTGLGHASPPAELGWRWQRSSKMRVSTSIGCVIQVYVKTPKQKINTLALLQEIWVVPAGVQLLAWSKAAEEVRWEWIVLVSKPQKLLLVFKLFSLPFLSLSLSVFFHVTLELILRGQCINLLVTTFNAWAGRVWSYTSRMTHSETKVVRMKPVTFKIHKNNMTENMLYRFLEKFNKSLSAALYSLLYTLNSF